MADLLSQNRDMERALLSAHAELDAAEGMLKARQSAAPVCAPSEASPAFKQHPPPQLPFSLPGYRPTNAITPVLVMCHNRPKYLREALDSIIANRPSATQFPIIVSQDGTDAGVWDLLEHDFADSVVAIQFQSRHEVVPMRKGENFSYYYIAQHYFFALSTVFDKLGYESVIILEDDLKIAPDFFDYFIALMPLLHDPDEDLYVISAWNDNGKAELIQDSAAVRRSDFFPGLGWMLTRTLWDELSPKWPEGYWDDWVRDDAQRKGRNCIYPEISRSYTFGEKGSSGGQFFKSHLQHIALNDHPQKFTKMDLSYLEKDNWDQHFADLVLNAKPSQIHEYSTHQSYQRLARTFGLMDDEKSGILRGSYKGVVWFWKNGEQVFVVPSNYRAIFEPFASSA
eukprot:TRINITY_DN6604_c0_g1_i1.p1 TRINITY_DN6604_c0_g1~~TRINITY_DN6604_c0_g1_i1.p1  ORF type:complete len:424 (+),score=64.19 TRINITY_DN6604_c0_g1_i1:83-1273(+)